MRKFKPFYDCDALNVVQRETSKPNNILEFSHHIISQIVEQEEMGQKSPVGIGIVCFIIKTGWLDQIPAGF